MLVVLVLLLLLVLLLVLLVMMILAQRLESSPSVGEFVRSLSASPRTASGTRRGVLGGHHLSDASAYRLLLRMHFPTAIRHSGI